MTQLWWSMILILWCSRYPERPQTSPHPRLCYILFQSSTCKVRALPSFAFPLLNHFLAIPSSPILDTTHFLFLGVSPQVPQTSHLRGTMIVQPRVVDTDGGSGPNPLACVGLAPPLSSPPAGVGETTLSSTRAAFTRELSFFLF